MITLNWVQQVSISMEKFTMSQESVQVNVQYDATIGPMEVKQIKYNSNYIRPYYCMLLGGLVDGEKIEELQTLSSLGLRVFLSVCRNLDGNIANVRIDLTAKLLGVGTKTLYNAVTDLRKHKLMQRIGPSWYVVNPRIVWKGNTENYPKAISQWDSLVNG